MTEARERPRLRFFAATRDGWELELFRHLPASDAPERHGVPVLIVPGYAQAPFLFEVHPKGPSLVASLVAGGFETWTLRLRGSGESRARDAEAGPVSLVTYADEDLPAAFACVAANGTTGSARAFVLGSSLGGSVVYAHLARSGSEQIAGVVALGSPLRWESPHPLVRALFASRGLAERVPMAGVARAAMRLMPPLARAGWLGAYVNRRHVSSEDARALVGGIVDPSPQVNAEVAEWLARGEFVLAGTDVAAALRHIEVPLLVVAANRDGTVPLAASHSVLEVWGGSDVEVLEVGTREDWFSHADLFVAPSAPERVFNPIVRWLAARVAASISA